MKNIQLLDGEKEVMTSPDEKFILTNLRILKLDDNTSQTSLTTISLKSVSGVKINHEEKKIFLYLSFLGLIIGGINLILGAPIGIGAIILGAIFYFIYKLTLKSVIAIYTNSQLGMDLDVKEFNAESIQKFVNKIEETKNKLSV